MGCVEWQVGSVITPLQITAECGRMCATNSGGTRGTVTWPPLAIRRREAAPAAAAAD